MFNEVKRNKIKSLSCQCAPTESAIVSAPLPPMLKYGGEEPWELCWLSDPVTTTTEGHIHICTATVDQAGEWRGPWCTERTTLIFALAVDFIYFPLEARAQPGATKTSRT